MFSIRSTRLPDISLLNRYAEQGANYTDCFVADVSAQVDLNRYIMAFYTSPLFKLERWILSLALRRPSTDHEARQLADGDCDSFAAWTVEERARDQLLMCDVSNRTRSWLMVDQGTNQAQPGTRLYFGSAVLPAQSEGSAGESIGLGYTALLGVHRFYSRALLWFAKTRLSKADQ